MAGWYKLHCGGKPRVWHARALKAVAPAETADSIPGVHPGAPGHQPPAYGRSRLPRRTALVERSICIVAHKAKMVDRRDGGPGADP